MYGDTLVVKDGGGFVVVFSLSSIHDRYLQCCLMAEAL